MDDIRQLFTEVFGVSEDLEDEQLVNAGCEMLAGLMRESGAPLSLLCPRRSQKILHIIKCRSNRRSILPMIPNQKLVFRHLE